MYLELFKSENTCAFMQKTNKQTNKKPQMTDSQVTGKESYWKASQIQTSELTKDYLNFLFIKGKITEGIKK